jgi:NADH:ubiquinone oxidoreductase subunit E
MPQQLPDRREVSSEEKAAMPQRKVEEYPPESRRKEIFQALVDAQDQEMSVAQSRKFVAERFGVTESQVRRIEQEGLDHEWPPL